jgi:hypothetical protein
MKCYTDENGFGYHCDSDGDRIYDEPHRQKSWDLSAPPSEMGTNTLCAAVAKEVLGCKIEWSGYYRDWCCMCKNDAHQIDQQCSIIMEYSSGMRIRDVVTAVAHLIRFDALTSPREICEQALQAVRDSKGPVKVRASTRGPLALPPGGKK